MKKTGYRIAWISKFTGFSSHGKSISKKTAEAWMKDAELRQSSLHHWVEKFCRFTLTWKTI